MEINNVIYEKKRERIIDNMISYLQVVTPLHVKQKVK